MIETNKIYENDKLNILIEEIKNQLKYVVKAMGIYDIYTTKTAHFEYDGFVYVTVNPLIQTFDNDGIPFRRYNLQITYTGNKSDYFTFDNGKFVSKSGYKIEPILIPFLIAKIDKSTLEFEFGT